MIDIFLKGGPVMWPILFCSILSLAIFFERLYMIMKSRRYVWESISRYKVKPLTDEGSSTSCNGIVKDLLSCTDNYSGNTLHDIEHRMYRFATVFIQSLEKRLNWLAIIGNVAPLLGLLGTVTGMIRVFMAIQDMQGQVNPSAIAGGIWEALITTAFGLIVAIPTLVAYHYFEDRIDEMVNAIKDIIHVILENKHEC